MAFRQIDGGEGAEVWVEADKGDAKVWLKGSLLAQSGPLVSVRDSRGRVKQVDLRKKAVEPANPKVEADMTALHHINEPGILFNLKDRSESDEPYTFMGNVLVAVNPLKRIADPIPAGKPQVMQSPHPYAVAEGAYQQMSFACDMRRTRATNLGELGNQSVITGGESGAGKTESSKMVLRHLVARTGSGEIDKRLLGSNPITEAFGNAATLRNHNSSRFGKFMKLHFKQLESRKDEPAKWQIVAGAVDTYLLERSRVTLHGEGERNFHIFYQLLAGGGPLLKEFGLDKTKAGFTYLRAAQTFSVVHGKKSEIHQSTDKANFKELQESLTSIGISDKESKEIFQVVAAVMHLGNSGFSDRETNEGDIATEVLPSGYSGLELSAQMFGVSKESLTKMLTERTVHARGETLTLFRNARAALYARDAVAKGVYSRLFDYVIARIDKSLDDSGTEHGAAAEELPYIGVLDIFGFESFQRNGFEQLLINFTNEALQRTFNQSVFIGELKLYQDEGLVLDEDMAPPPDNTGTMELLVGDASSSDSYQRRGLLMTIVVEGQGIEPNDTKMNDRFHRCFNKHPSFPRPHPKDRSSTFIVKHYAGAVVYTVGNFLEKNSDKLPEGVPEVFAGSSMGIVKELFPAPKARMNGHGRRRKASGGESVVNKFRSQINALVETLESTRCSFIRCVKPNAMMERGKGWFDLLYISQQLRCLSIPQTAEVLKAGLPTRVAYSSLVDSYKRALPRSAVRVWEKMGGGNPKAFVAALFWAFEVQRDTYKLGHTRVFFKSGQLAQLDHILQAAAGWEGSSDKKVKAEQVRIAKRFRLYYIRTVWRRAFVKVVAVNRFQGLLDASRRRIWATKKLQSFFRMVVERVKYLRLIKAERKRLKKLAEAEAASVVSEEPPAGIGALNLTEADLESEDEEERKQAEDAEYQAISEALNAKKEQTRRMSDFRALSIESTNPDAQELSRREELAMTILEQAREAEQRDYDGASIKPSEADRRRALEKYEDHYARNMARYEAARMRYQRVRVGFEDATKLLGELWTNVLKGMNLSNLQKSLETIKEETSKLIQGEHNKELQTLIAHWQRQWGLLFTPDGRTELIRQWYESLRRTRLKMETRHKRMMALAAQQPWYKNAVRDYEELVKMTSRDKQGKMNRSVSKGLKRIFHLNEMELMRPFRSAEQQMQNLKRLQERGVISPDEYARSLADITRTLERAESNPGMSDRRPGASSDAAVQVTCRSCGKPGNTMYGPRCGYCSARLPVASGSGQDHRVDWFDELRYHGGKLKVRFDGSVQNFDQDTFTSTVLFKVEMLWVGPNQGADTRFESWSVGYPFPAFQKLDEDLHSTKGKKAFPKSVRSSIPRLDSVGTSEGNGSVSPSALGRRKSARQSLGRLRSSLSTRSLAAALSQRSSVMLEKGKGISTKAVEAKEAQVRDWLAGVFQAAAKAKANKKGDTPLLALMWLDHFLELKAHLE